MIHKMVKRSSDEKMRIVIRGGQWSFWLENGVSNRNLKIPSEPTSRVV